MLGALLLCRVARGTGRSTIIDVSLCKFVLGLALAMPVGALAKGALTLPGPFIVLDEAAYRAAAAPDSRYTMPSGHASYVRVLAAALRRLLGSVARVGLLPLAAAVGWSRVALGAHSPADVAPGYALDWAGVVAAGPASRRRGPRLGRAGVSP